MGDNNDDGGVGGIGDTTTIKTHLLTDIRNYIINKAYLFMMVTCEIEYHGYGKLYNEQGQIIYEGYWDNGKNKDTEIYFILILNQI